MIILLFLVAAIVLTALIYVSFSSKNEIMQRIDRYDNIVGKIFSSSQQVEEKKVPESEGIYVVDGCRFDKVDYFLLNTSNIVTSDDKAYTMNIKVDNLFVHNNRLCTVHNERIFKASIMTNNKIIWEKDISYDHPIKYFNVSPNGNILYTYDGKSSRTYNRGVLQETQEEDFEQRIYTNNINSYGIIDDTTFYFGGEKIYNVSQVVMNTFSEYETLSTNETDKKLIALGPEFKTLQRR